MDTSTKKRVVIYGTGDMGIQVFNIIKHDKNIEVIGFLDFHSNKKGSLFLNHPVLGTENELSMLINDYQLDGGIAAIGNNKLRYEINQQLKNSGLEIIKAIHPKAFIDNADSIGNGTILEMGTYIHPEAIVGEGCFICCGAVVAHNSRVGNYVVLAGGSIFGSRVEIGDYSLIGVGANISPYISIGKNVLVGTGAAVVKNLPDNVVAAGVPAKILRENN